MKVTIIAILGAVVGALLVLMVLVALVGSSEDDACLKADRMINEHPAYDSMPVERWADELDVALADCREQEGLPRY